MSISITELIVMFRSTAIICNRWSNNYCPILSATRRHPFLPPFSRCHNTLPHRHPRNASTHLRRVLRIVSSFPNGFSHSAHKTHTRISQISSGTFQSWSILHMSPPSILVLRSATSSWTLRHESEVPGGMRCNSWSSCCATTPS